ncbi:MAG: bifunctional phosphopantothenoylcysteine decarboxylase/phosphopantothenate--cysteine ligase CoaBC [Bacteriovoracaceae bacterium]
MNILLCVTGSISAYKSYDLCRSLVKEGHHVKVLLSAGALEFINPNTFKYLGAEAFGPQDDFKHSGVLHVDLARWAQSFVIAPLSANKLSDLVMGKASDLISSVFLALDLNIPKLFFPAMNTHMLNHPFVKDNFNKLKGLAHTKVFDTQSGKLVCGEEGEGKLENIEVIKDCIESLSFNSSSEHILISTGATIAPVDPVRYLTNPSSGITGYHLAKEALKQGHRVTVIAGQMATHKLDFLNSLDSYQLIRVKTTNEMYEQVHQYFPHCTRYYSSAAISDFEFDTELEKLKKSSFSQALTYKKAPDVLRSVLKLKKNNQKVIGFAAETQLNEQILKEKYESKPVDLLVGTRVHSGIKNKELQGFQNENGSYLFYSKNGIQFEGNLNKSELAKEILEIEKYD